MAAEFKEESKNKVFEGTLTKYSFKVRMQAGDDEPNVVVVDPVQALPLPAELLELAADARAVVTVEDGVAERGIGAALALCLVQQATVSTPAPAMRVLGVNQEFIPHAKRDAILAANGLDAEGIGTAIRVLLR